MVCYYCNQQTYNELNAHKFKMYNVLSRDFDIDLVGIKKTTKYYEQEVQIPRCANCYQIHKNANRPAIVFSLIGAIVGLAFGWYFGKRWYISFGGCALGFFISLLSYYQFIYRVKLKGLGIKDQYEIQDHPLVLEAKKDGWQLTKI